ncbi:MAG TPA: universal stress protein [Marmoricola sp.]|nr:universal stress protein [Marmoricola sp.]
MTAEVDQIIVGVDNLDLSRDAIGWGVAEAEARRVPLRLVHAIRILAVPEPVLLAGAYAWPEIPASVLREAGEEILKHAEGYARSLAPGLEISTQIHQGDTVSVLEDVAHPHGLIVIGSRRLGAVRANLFGSVGTGLAHTSSSMFVVVRGEHEIPPDAPVIVGVDPSAECATVLKAAFEEAALHHRALRTVIGWEPYFNAPPDRQNKGFRDVRTEVELWLAEALAGWQEAYPDVQVQRHLAFDYPTTALTAQSVSAALVVVGVGGGLIGRIGSVAAGVLHHAACPVVVIPR